MIFHTRVGGIPCQCLVYSYYPAVPMRITGTGFGDADPPEDEVFEFRLLDRKGYPADWLERKLTNNDADRIKKEYLAL
jgi:hypothetical protein